MDRRHFLFGLLASTALAPLAAYAASDLKVIYIGGWDCPPCNAWKKNRKQGWLDSAEFKQVTWIEVEAPNLKRAYEDTYWPAQLRSIRDQLPKKSGTPRFVVVKDGKVVANHFGGTTWDNALADIKKALAKA